MNTMTLYEVAKVSGRKLYSLSVAGTLLLLVSCFVALGTAVGDGDLQVIMAFMLVVAVVWAVGAAAIVIYDLVEYIAFAVLEWMYDTFRRD